MCIRDRTWILAIIKQRDLKCSNDSPIKLKQQINTRVSFRLHVLDAVRNANRHLEQTGGETTRALELTIALSTGILTLSAKFCDENNVSWRIVRNHQCTLHLMAERGAAIDSALLSGIDAAGDNHETCEICSATIPFKDNTWARCQRGHQFGEFQEAISCRILTNGHAVRCGLSYIAIQAPRISKSCGLCNREYLKFESLGAANVENQKNSADHTNQEDQPTLAEYLFETFDVCIYCGGKFGE